MAYQIDNLIPEFILLQESKNNNLGSFSASVLFLDISGFTAITERLMEFGKEGSEAVSTILNEIFTPTIDILYSYHGFISNFAGDAFTAIFPENLASIEEGLLSAQNIRNNFYKLKDMETRYGRFKISVKIGLSWGKVNWSIVDGRQKTYYFRGQAIIGAAAAEHKCHPMDIIIDQTFLNQLPDSLNVKTEKLTEVDFYLIQKLDNIPALQIISSHPKQIEKKCIEKFISPSLRKTNYYSEEFREVVALFLSFKIKTNVDQLISEIVTELILAGGYLSSIDFADKGPMMLILFGAPVNYENNIIRAVRLAHQLTTRSSQQIKIALNFGSTFSGFIGSERRFSYTCLGDVINLTSRIITKTPWGKVRFTEEVASSIKNFYSYRKLKLMKFKGKQKPQQVYELQGKIDFQSSFQFSGNFIGRDDELNQLVKYCKSISRGKFGGVIYIYGDAGIGKSRLLSECLVNLYFDYFTAFVNPDRVNQISLYGLIKFLNHYFKLSNITETDERKQHFESNYFQLLKLFNDQTRISELIRIKTIIGSVIGLHWENSIFEKIDPKDKHEAVIFAIKDFFTSLSMTKPLILVVEDLQWLDKDSIEALTILTRNISQYPIILICLSRYTGKYKIPKLPVDSHITVNNLILNELTDKSAYQLASETLGFSLNPDFFQALYKKAQGNPLFIEQYCLYLKNKHLQEVTSENYSFNESNIPSTINSIIIARIDQLNISLRELIKLTAVLGMEFQTEILDEIIKTINTHSDYSLHSISNYLNPKRSDELLKNGLKERIWHVITELKYTFNHSLLREAAYQMQLKKTLRKLHSLTGNIMIKYYSNNPEEYHHIAYHFYQAEQLNQALIFYQKAAEFSKENYKILSSIDFWKKAILLSKNIYGDKSHQEDLLLINLAKTYLLAENFDLAMNCLNIAKMNENFKEISLEYSELIFLKGVVNKSIGEYQQALQLQEKSREIRIKLSGTKDFSISENLSEIGWIYWYLAKYDKAIKTWNQVRKIRIELLGQTDLSVADVLDDLGMAYGSKGDYQKSYSYHQQALKMRTAKLDTHHFDFAFSYNNLSVVLKKTQRFIEALDYSFKSMNLLKSTIGEKCNTVAILYNNIAVIYWDQGDYDNAIEYQMKNISIITEIYGHDHIDLATSYNNIGTIYLKLQNFNKAIDNLKKSVEIFKKSFGEKHPNISVVYFNIAETYLKMGDQRNYFGYHLESLEMKEATLGEDHPLTSDSYRVLGQAYLKKQDYLLAIDFSQKALENMISRDDIENPKTAEIYLCLGDTYYQQKNNKLALEMYLNSREIYKILKITQKIDEIDYKLETIDNLQESI